MQGQLRQHLWAWNVSALVYEWAYIRVAHQTDVDLLAYLGDKVAGAIIADCGCGPGVVSEKLIRAGAATVVAIDSNAGMIEKTRQRLLSSPTDAEVVIHHGSHEGDLLGQVVARQLGGRRFDVVLFKRSLYMPRARAVATLRQAAAVLQPQGRIVVVHPERQLQRYAFARPLGVTRYTLFHLFNRAISRLAERCGAEEYRLYSRRELLDLLGEAVPEAIVEAVPSQQHPYNLVALRLP